MANASASTAVNFGNIQFVTSADNYSASDLANKVVSNFRMTG